MTSFQKHDTGKPRYSLLVDEFVHAMVEVLEYGAHKYGPNNWMQCQDPDRCYNALRRHLYEFRRGARIDSESGLHHLAQVAVNAMFLWWLDQQQERNQTC